MATPDFKAKVCPLAFEKEAADVSNDRSEMTAGHPATAPGLAAVTAGLAAMIAGRTAGISPLPFLLIHPECFFRRNGRPELPGKPEPDLCPMAGFADDVERALVIGQDLADDGQAQSRTRE